MSLTRVIGVELDAHGIWRSRAQQVSTGEDVLDLDLQLFPLKRRLEVDFHGDGQRQVTVHSIEERPGFGWIDLDETPGPT